MGAMLIPYVPILSGLYAKGQLRNMKKNYLILTKWICIATLPLFILFFFFPELIRESKDYDYRLLLKGMDNGLINFYDPITDYDWPPYYLYFWFFLFFPMYLMPFEIGVYVWDILRLVMGIFIINEAPKILSPYYWLY